MSIYFLGLGSNQGERLANLQEAISHIEALGQIKSSSLVYETEPKYYSEQPKFLNMACELESELSPIELFHAVKKIESDIGRVPTHRNGPRVIDIDLLLSPTHTYCDSNLQLPHPRLGERAFVLVPLAEIAASIFLPDKSCTIQDLVNELDKNLLSEVKVLKI